LTARGAPPPAARDARFAELAGLFRAALEAVDGTGVVRAALRREGARLAVAGRALDADARLRVLAVGKAAPAMAAGAEEIAGDRIAAGLVVARDPPAAPLRRSTLRLAAHPVPDARSESAAREALRFVAGGTPDDVLLVLLSGGASSLLAGPLPGLGLADLAATTRALLRAGAPIDELNAVRKHLALAAGGRLAQAARARQIEVLAISDVPGDRIDVIGSGPFAADPSTFADALAALRARGLAAEVGERVIDHLARGARGELVETPKPGDAALSRVRHAVVASNATAIEAARGEAERRGLRSLALAGFLRGEARDAGASLVARARAARGAERLVLVAGGETTVTVRGTGRGGRSQELALAAACAIEGDGRIAVLAAGTDGIDGPTDAAGAFADGATLARGRAVGLDARACLAANDSHRFFAGEGGLFVTGPTRTNAMDLALASVDAADPGSAGTRA
jgi:glycerate 2-kinase